MRGDQEALWPVLLALLEEAAEGDRLVEAPGSSTALPGDGALRPQDCRTYTTLQTEVLALCARHAQTLAAPYRTRMEAQARAHRARASAARDPYALERCARRFPLTRSAGHAVLEAAWLFLERGATGRAAAACRTLPDGCLDADHRAQLGHLQRLLASALQPAARAGPAPAAADEHLDAELTGAGTDDNEICSAGSDGRFANWRRRTTLESEWTLAWVAGAGFDDGARSQRLGRRVRHPYELTVTEAWCGVASHDGVLRFEVQSGARLPRLAPAVAPRQPASYREDSSHTRWEMALAERSLLVPTLVEVREAIGFGSGSRLVQVALPRRSLELFDLDDEAVPRRIWHVEQCPDEVVRALSFTGRATVTADAVVALGWRSAGFVDAWVVCFDRRTGRLRWRTLVGNGQSDLTRFGALAVEPWLGSVVAVEDESAFLVTTGLGMVARVRHDGALAWVTAYNPRRQPLNIHQRRHLRYPFDPDPGWTDAPPIVLEDRWIVAPADSEWLFALDPRTGRVLERRRGPGQGAHLLGPVDGLLVVCSPDRITLFNAHSLVAPARELPVDGTLAGRPAMAGSGILYASPHALCWLPLDGDGVRTLVRFGLPVGDWDPAGQSVLEGRVSWRGDRVFVTNRHGIRCYQWHPRPPPATIPQPR